VEISPWIVFECPNNSISAEKYLLDALSLKI